MDVFSAIVDARRRGHRGALATVLASVGSAPRHAGARMLLRDDGLLVGTIGGGTLEHTVLATCREVLATGVAQRVTTHLTRDLGMCCGGEVDVYIEPIEPSAPFYLVGAGHVAAACAPLLRSLEFDVTVIDAREEWCNIDRFPGCTVIVDDPVSALGAIPPRADAWWLVATHDHPLDQAVGQALLTRPFAWAGMIGSRAKIAKFFLRWRAAGIDEATFTRLSAPVGLDLGAETPAEIAVAIAAEVVRVRRDQREPPLALSERPIAARGGDGRATPPRWTAADASVGRATRGR